MAGRWDAAVQGSSALRAGILQVLLIELSRRSGRHWCLLLWDLAKFYDTITLPLLVFGAVAKHYPPQLLFFIIINYISMRTLRTAGSLSEWVQPNSSTLAGCGEANNMARVALFDIMERVATGNPRMSLQSFVDDVKIF